MRQKSGSPFLYDDVTGDIVGIRDPDGSEKLLVDPDNADIRAGRIGGAVTAPATGSASSRAISAWLADTQRRRSPINMTIQPVMTSPPTVELVKCTGITAAAVSAGGTGYAVNDIITVAGGTTSYPAKVRVTAVSGGAVTGAAVEMAGVYTSGATPSNPASQASTTGAGTGATFNLTFNSSAAASQVGTQTYGPTNAVHRFTGMGPSNISGSGYYGNSVSNGLHCMWEWSCDETQFDLKLLGLNTKADLLVSEDGNAWRRVSSTLISTDVSGAPFLYTVAWGGSNKPRHYRLVGYNMGFGGVIVKTSATVWFPVGQYRPLAWGLGDSYMAGTGASQICNTAFQIMCDALGMDAIANGVGSQGWNSSGGNLPATRVTAGLGALVRTPQFVFLDMGFNDAGGDMVTAAANFADCVAAVRTVTPQARIICFGPATPLGSTGNLTLVKNMLSTQCAALGLDFIDVDNWVSSSNKSLYTGGDNIHPNDAGHAYIGGRKAQAVSTVL